VRHQLQQQQSQPTQQQRVLPLGVLLRRVLVGVGLQGPPHLPLLVQAQQEVADQEQPQPEVHLAQVPPVIITTTSMSTTTTPTSPRAPACPCTGSSTCTTCRTSCMAPTLPVHKGPSAVPPGSRLLVGVQQRVQEDQVQQQAAVTQQGRPAAPTSLLLLQDQVVQALLQAVLQQQAPHIPTRCLQSWLHFSKPRHQAWSLVAFSVLVLTPPPQLHHWT
jgi:hypothetical protein